MLLKCAANPVAEYLATGFFIAGPTEEGEKDESKNESDT